MSFIRVFFLFSWLIVPAVAFGAVAPGFDTSKMAACPDRALTEHEGSSKEPVAQKLFGIAGRRSSFRPCDASFKPVAVVYRHNPSEVFSAVQKKRHMLADLLVRIAGNEGNISDGDADEVCELARDMYDALSPFPALQTSFRDQAQTLQINTANLELLQSLLGDILKKLPGKEIQLSADLQEALEDGKKALAIGENKKRKRGDDDTDALPAAKRPCSESLNAHEGAL